MKKVKILTIILAIILVILIAFGGIYIRVQNRMEDKVKDYSYAMDLKGTRSIRLKVDESKETIIKDSEGKEVEETEDLTDEQIAEKGYTKEEVPSNTEEVLNEENYLKSKKILEQRLNEMGVDNYIVKLDKQTGDIIIEIPENDKTDLIVSNIGTPGKFEILDSETNEVLMNNNDIKLANVMYGTDSTTGTTGTTVYLNIQFTKEGAKKLEDITSKYVEVETSENTESTESTEGTEENTENTETTEKTVTMKIDDEEIMSTSFDETIKTGKMQLSIGSSSTEQETLQEYVEQASSMAVVLDNGKMPVKYEVDENEYVLSDITNDDLKIVGYAVVVVAIIALAVLVIRYKGFGLLGAISYIGLAAIFVLLIRYANVVLSIEGIFGIAITLILNYIFVNKLLAKTKKKAEEKNVVNMIKETYKEFFIKIVPICIVVVTFCFMNWNPISSFGMVMFWGISLIALYNLIVTSNLLKIKASK